MARELANKFDKILRWLDKKSNYFLSHLASITFFGFELIYWSTVGWFKKKSFPRREIFRQMSTAGVDTLPMVAMVALLVGVMLVLQTVYVLERYGQREFVSGVVSVSMTREFGPLLTAIIFTGRVGAAYTAELGTMKVSEELLALETMAINPIAYLISPRLIAAVIAVPALIILADYIGMFGGFLIATQYFGISQIGWDFVLKTFTKTREIWFGVQKGVLFAIIIITISCYKGFTVEGGGEQVGRATMQSVVICLVAIIFSDTLYTLLYNILFR